MLNRFKKAMEYGYKGALYFAPLGTITSGLIIGIYYTTKYILYRGQRYDELRSNNYDDCSPDDITCRLHYRTDGAWLQAIEEVAGTYGTAEATAELQAIWPVFVVPCMTVGMVAGAIYGFCLPVKAGPIFTEFSDDESPDCLEAFKDPVFYHRMRDPYALNCGGDHNLEYNTLLQLEPNNESKLCCPICRREIKGPCPNKELRIAIEKYVSNKKRKDDQVKKIPTETTVLLENKPCVNVPELERKAMNEMPDENSEIIEGIDRSDHESDENNVEVFIDHCIEGPNTNNQIESNPLLVNFSLFASKKVLRQPECENNRTNKNQLSHNH